MMEFVTRHSSCISLQIIDFHLHFSYSFFFGNMGYKLGIIDFLFHFHVFHTYYDYLNNSCPPFLLLQSHVIFVATLTPNIPRILLNWTPLIINIINIPIEVTQENAHLNFQDRKHIVNNCYNVVLMLINVKNRVLHRFAKILIIYCN